MLEKELWKYALVVVIALGIFGHLFYPRYDWHTLQGSDSVTVVIYDRWTGQFQRAVYANTGGLNVMGVYTPSF